MRPKIVLNVSSASFFLLHLACLAVLLVHFSWWAVGLGVLLYLVRMFAVTAGYHRYFSHRTYRMGRLPQFLMAFLAQTSAQKGVLWWAAHHRNHHRYSDTEQDIHSPVRKGFWWSHMGWILVGTYDTYEAKEIADFGKYPELRFLDRYHWLCPWALGTATWVLGVVTGVGGWTMLVWGFVVSTVFLYHGTFTINSLCHVWGSRRFATSDTSRNNFVLSLITLGEGWHNNHHHYQASCAQGLRWWEIDPTYYALKMLGWLRVVRDIRTFPAAVQIAAKARLGVAMDQVGAHMEAGLEAARQRLEEAKVRVAEAQASAAQTSAAMVADARDRLAEAKERLAEAQAAFQSLAGPQIS
jgi:stearoyl-CoA desaturase (delta-9 desaturase)